MQNKEITFGCIIHAPEVFNKYYYPSLTGLLEYSQSMYGVYFIPEIHNGNFPATLYNKIIRKSTTKYICLTHTDVTFSPDFIDNIFKTIEQVPDFGALGIVGVDHNGKYHWASEHEIKRVETLDCCCIIINKEHGILFDEKNFNEFHLYVEDYCQQVNEKGLGCYTLLTNAAERPPSVTYHDIKEEKNFFNHHSVTLNRLGTCWGRYHEFKKILNEKWKRQVMTT